MSASGLYTTEILAKAMELAGYPWAGEAPLRGAASSRSCGSSIELSLMVDEAGRVSSIGVRPHACAIGQAAAALFAGGAIGRDREDVARTRSHLADWLGGIDSMPEWPGIELLGPALSYPARHAAILLPWDAALAGMPVSVAS
ncbi:MAG: iron-sulfur cluster assembly scaffold protein [Novosphingobium sp.]